MSAPRLARAALAAAGAPVATPPARIVHLGVGAFHRAHQAWYTAHAADSDEWGIAAFTGRSDAVARSLAPQDGLFTLVERGPGADRLEIVGSIAEVHAADRVDRLDALLADPRTAVVTLTVTEAGYHLGPDGTLDATDPAVVADIRALREGLAPGTPIGRLLRGLDRRRAAGAPPVAVVPCDNLPDNGTRLARALADLAEASGVADAGGAASFVTTTVDRITPRTTAADLALVEAESGWRDDAAVVTEPFSDWTLSGDFPSGRPAWETAGALFVDDVEGYARRKLLVLNGGHLVLAFEGLLRGRATVAEAMADRACRRALDAFWDEAVRAIPGGVDTNEYRRALERRFENGRIEHRLAQIAVDTATKLRLRVLPVVRAERAAGRDGDGSLAVVSAWAACVRSGLVAGFEDPASAVADLLEGADERDAVAISRAATGLAAVSARD